MRILGLLIFILMMVFSCKKDGNKNLKYPKITPSVFFDSLHGEEISDPYRNLENLKDTTVLTWFRENEKLSDSILSEVPKRDFFHKKLKKLTNQKREIFSSYYIADDGSYFYLKTSKPDEPKKLYYRKEKKSTEILIMDPVTYKKDWRINYFKVSWNRTKVAISLSPNGEDKSEVVIYDFEKQSLLDHVVLNLAPLVAGSIEWLPDNTGFIYVRLPHFRYDDPSYLANSESILFKIGEEKIPPKILFSKVNNPNIPFSSGDIPQLSISDSNSPYLFGCISNVSNYRTTYYSSISNLEEKKLNWKLLFNKEEQIPQFYVKDDFVYYRTAKNNSEFTICKVHINKLNFNSPEILVQPIANETIVDFRIFEDTVFLVTLKNGIEGKLYQKVEGQPLKEITLPMKSGDTKLDIRGENLIVSTVGWTKSNTLFEYDLKKGSFRDVMLSQTNSSEFENLIVEEVEIPSHDGVLVPLSIIYKKGLKKNGRNRTFILTYGSYGTITSPTYVEILLVWLSKGDIIAVPHVRGGGEKGRDWHMAGHKSTKPNTWKDFIASTQYLIDEGYTSEEYTVAFGNSAGGIPVGRAMTERPDLYATTIMTAPALNMLRCEFQPNGQTNIPEFGTVNDSTEFVALKAMDSYYHLKKTGKYPSTLIQVGMNDGVVTPWDPAKFIAKLQNMTETTEPALLSVDLSANHMGDGTLDGVFRKYSDLYSFALWQTGHPEFQPK